MSRSNYAEDLYEGESDVPEMNEQPYYVARLKRSIRNAQYGGPEWLIRMKLSTLKLIDEHEVPSDLEYNTLRKYDEDQLRNLLFIGSIGDNKGTSLSNLAPACDVVQLHHKLRTDDLTKLPEAQAEMVADAVHFLIKSKLFEFAPPRLTDYVMRNPGTTPDILEYIEKHKLRKDDAHSIDLDHLDEYINNPSRALRDGVL